MEYIYDGCGNPTTETKTKLMKDGARIATICFVWHDFFSITMISFGIDHFTIRNLLQTCSFVDPSS